MHPLTRPLPIMAIALSIACCADMMWPVARLPLAMVTAPGVFATALAARYALPQWRRAAALLVAPVILLVHPHQPALPLPEDAELVATVAGAPMLGRDGARVRITSVVLDGTPLPAGAELELDVPSDLGRPEDLLPGVRISTFATLRAHRRSPLPWARDRRRLLLRRGVLGRARAEEPVRILPGRAPVHQRARAALVSRRVGIEQRVRRLLGDDRAATILAMTLGSRGLLTDAQRKPFADTGTAHVLAISGLHLGALAALLWWAARPMTRLRLRALARHGRARLLGAPVLLVMCAYVVAIGAPASARRALVMTACAVAAVMAWRRPCLIHAVALAIVAILCVDPAAVLDPGAQLSVSACLGIALALHERPRAQSARERLSASARVSLAAGLATAPIILDLQGSFALIGLLANLAVVPLVGLVIFPAMLLGLGAIDISEPLASAILSRCAWAMDALGAGLAASATLPGAHITPASLPLAALVVMSLGIFVALGARQKKTSTAAWVCVLTALLGPWSMHRHSPGTLRLHALPVGQGDATLVEFPDGRAWLIDAGGRRRGPDVGANVVVPALRRLGVRRLDALVITHADLDHIGGARAVLNMMAPRRLLVNPREERDAMHDLVAEAHQLDIPVVPVHRTHHETIGGAAVRIITPNLDSPEPNDSSLVTSLLWRGVRVVLPGDLEADGEAWWLEHHGARATILKAGHHGSKTSTTQAWVDALDPELALISCGSGNHFGHPHAEVLERLAAAGATIARTDAHGLVRVTVDDLGHARAQVTHTPGDPAVRTPSRSDPSEAMHPPHM